MRVAAYNTVYAIVYATGSKIIRRVIVPEQDWHLFDGWRRWLTWACPGLTRRILPTSYSGGGLHRCAAGETMIFAPAGNNDTTPEWENHVFDATGAVPPDPKCAIVLNGKVIGFCCADPALDVPDEEGAHLKLLNGRRVDIGEFI